MNKNNLILKIAENIAKRDILLVAMEDMRVTGNIQLHLKYLEMYESLKSECKEFESQLNASIAA